MSSELWLLVPNGSIKKKQTLDGLLKSRGYNRTHNFLITQKGVWYYSWYDYNDFKSYDGVEVDVRIANETKELQMHVRCRCWASYYDILEQNEVVRQAKKMLGGYIEGDYGKNRYVPLWKDSSTPMSRGIGMVYDRISENIRSINYALPKEQIADSIKKKRKEKGKKLDRNDISVTEFICSMGPSRILYNELMPFLVACIESFLKEAFIILLKYDAKARSLLRKKGKREIYISFDELCQIEDKDTSPEEIISKEYNFQNLKSAKEAYLKYFNIDIEGVLRKVVVRKNHPRVDLYERLNELIDYRHKIIHELAVNTQLTRKKFQEYIKNVSKCLDEVLKAIEKRYSIKIEVNP